MDPALAPPTTRRKLNRFVIRIASFLLIVLFVLDGVILLVDISQQRPVAPMQVGAIGVFALVSWVMWWIMRGFFQHLVLFITIWGCAVAMLVNPTMRVGSLGLFWAGLVVVVAACVLAFWPVDDNDEVYFRGGGGSIGYREVHGPDGPGGQ